MATVRQIEANRRNAAGPHKMTESGKQAIRGNAIRHGLAARVHVVLPGEDQDFFNEILDSLRAEYAPSTTQEELLLHQIVESHWRILRARNMESGSFLQVEADFARQYGVESTPKDDLTRGAYKRRLSAYAHDLERGMAYPFLVFRQEDGAMVGGITLSNVRRGVAQMGSIGYWVGQDFTRRGYTVAAVNAVTRFAFLRLGLHRVEAACIPTNDASKGVLFKAGFKHEGLARAYLRINGIWRDHLLFGMISSAPANEQRHEDVLV